MITAEPTNDMQLVRDVFTHPAVWPGVHDDSVASAAEWSPIESPGITYLAIRDGDVVCGLAMLYPINAATFELHSAMLPEARGDKTREAAKAMMSWLWDNTPASKIMTWVPRNNIAARAGAVRAGFKEEGRLTLAYLKDGLLQDLLLYGVSKCPPPSPTS